MAKQLSPRPITFTVALIACAALAFQGSRAAEVDYENPVIPGDHPDPSIIRVGKDYWATATSSEWGPQFPLLHSTDLVNWEQTGVVFQHRPDWAAANFWAPEISHFLGKYYVYYVGRVRDNALGVAVAIADKPSGPYVDHGVLVSQPAGSIDPVPCMDENGKPYLVWKEDNNSVHKVTPLWAQPLNEDGTKLIGERKELIRNDADWEGALVEGPYVLRRGDWFYLFYSGNGCCGPGCNYAMGVARSHSLLGPWEKNPSNPILMGNADWKCPGHGSIVTDERGRYWLLYHAYSTHSSVYTGREAMLDEVVFGANDWPTINNGRGPSAKAVSPYGSVQKKNRFDFADDFRGSDLKPGWQWPQNDEPAAHVRQGHLFLSAGPHRVSKSIAAIVARSTITGDYTATTIVESSALHTGTSAGISAFGDPYNNLGLSVGDGKLTLWRDEHGRETQIAQLDAPKAKKIYLRLISKSGSQFRFAASGDGKNWMPVGDDILGKYLPPWDRSIRVALTVGGADNAEGEFDSFRIEPSTVESLSQRQ